MRYLISARSTPTLRAAVRALAAEWAVRALAAEWVARNCFYTTPGERARGHNYGAWLMMPTRGAADPADRWRRAVVDNELQAAWDALGAAWVRCSGNWAGAWTFRDRYGSTRVAVAVFGRRHGVPESEMLPGIWRIAASDSSLEWHVCDSQTPWADPFRHDLDPASNDLQPEWLRREAAKRVAEAAACAAAGHVPALPPMIAEQAAVEGAATAAMGGR